MNKDKQDLESALHLLDNRPVADFEGLSKADMRNLLCNPFSLDSPLKINRKIPDKVLNRVHFFRQVELFLKMVHEKKSIKLTAKGNLPVAFVKENYNKGFIKDDLIEDKIVKVHFEKNCFPVQYARDFSELSGFIITKKNKLYLSVSYKDLLNQRNRQDLFLKLFTTFALAYFWEDIIQFPSYNFGKSASAYSLYLVSKYGNKYRSTEFYCDRFRRAFPNLEKEFTDFRASKLIIGTFDFVYYFRTFYIFMRLFNLVHYRERPDLRPFQVMIKKTNIFDRIITFE